MPNWPSSPSVPNPTHLVPDTLPCTHGSEAWARDMGVGRDPELLGAGSSGAPRGSPLQSRSAQDPHLAPTRPVTAAQCPEHSGGRTHVLLCLQQPVQPLSSPSPWQGKCRPAQHAACPRGAACSTLAPVGQTPVCGQLEKLMLPREEQNGPQRETVRTCPEMDCASEACHHRAPTSSHPPLTAGLGGHEGPGKGSLLSAEGHALGPPSTPWLALERGAPGLSPRVPPPPANT